MLEVNSGNTKGYSQPIMARSRKTTDEDRRRPEPRCLVRLPHWESTPPAHAPGRRDVSACPLTWEALVGTRVVSTSCRVTPLSCPTLSNVDSGAYRLVPGTDVWTVLPSSLRYIWAE